MDPLGHDAISFTQVGDLRQRGLLIYHGSVGCWRGQPLLACDHELWPALVVAVSCQGAGKGGLVAAIWQLTPRQSILAECQRRGKPAVVEGCINLLCRCGDVDDGLVLALGGPHAQLVLDGHEGGKSGYWPRVWAARGLLHAWDDGAGPAIIQATTDDAWRVREMAAKVIARHYVGDALTAVAELVNDPVPRVRAAAERAVVILTAGST
jgi:hypothetical protein